MVSTKTAPKDGPSRFNLHEIDQRRLHQNLRTSTTTTQLLKREGQELPPPQLQAGFKGFRCSRHYGESPLLLSQSLNPSATGHQ
uniref:Uncharacterized protein n=1 Tax=Cucumis sativus TaxID=3659 RepID=A0A0A0LR95_CUCSA